MLPSFQVGSIREACGKQQAYPKQTGAPHHRGHQGPASQASNQPPTLSPDHFEPDEVKRRKATPPKTTPREHQWSEATGSFISWVAKYKGDEKFRSQMDGREVTGRSNCFSESVCRKMSVRKVTDQHPMELYDPWISGPLRVS